MAENKANNLLDAISIVAESVAKKYQYDQTIEAKIVSVARKDQGIYKCEYENAIFDAYSSDTQSFYENETVYVNIPRGDFSKQKHIIGRKVDLEKAPNKTFNFKMPFDDFVGLENLTIESPYVRPKQYGFWANYALHGNKQEISNDYKNTVNRYSVRLSAADDTYRTALKNADSRYENLQMYLTDSFLLSKNIQILGSGSKLENVIWNGQRTYLERLVELFEQGNNNLVLDTLDAYSRKITGTNQSQAAYIGQDDINVLQDAARRYYETAYISAKLAWESSRQNIINELNETYNVFTGGNYNLLWSWSNTGNTSKMLVETKLGIALDIQTDLHDSLPRKGEYGLRIIISGKAQQTDDAPAQQKTTDIYWTNDQMYGNTYAFYTPYRQQRIIDISNYLTIDRIDIFFYQDTDNSSTNGYFINANGERLPKQIAPNFIDSYGSVIPYTYDAPDGTSYAIPYNIFCDNLEVLLGLTAEECQTDRVILYTYDDPVYGMNEFSTQDRSMLDTRELKFAWIHKMDNGDMVLVDHARKENANDIRALETYGAEIYWYHYVYGAPQDNDDLIYKYGGLNWQFLTDEKIFYELIENEGQETEIVHRYQMYGKFDITVQPDIKKATEKWKAVLVHKGVPYASDPIVFKNADGSIENNPDLVNDVVIKILHETLDAEGNNVIKENNSLKNFYVYDENGKCIQDEDGRTWSDLWFYVQIWVKNYIDGQYYPIALANENGYDPDTVDIKWIFPGANSMMQDFFNITEQDLSNAALAPTVESNQALFNEAIKKSTKKFHIKPHWDLRAVNNTIAAIVNRNGRVYKPQITFEFGLSGTMGTPYTVTLVQDMPVTQCLIRKTQFKIRAVVFDEHGREVPNRNYVFSWELLAPTIITTGPGRADDSDIANLNWKTAFASVVPTDDNQGNIRNVISGYIRNDYPPVFRVTVRGAADYPITATKAFSLSDSSTINVSYEINCPNKIEFKADGTIPTTINSPFEVNMLDSVLTKHAIHPDWELVQYKLVGSTWQGPLAPENIACIGLKATPIAQVNLTTNTNPALYCYKSNGVYDFDRGFTVAPDANHNTRELYESLKQGIKLQYDSDIDLNTNGDTETLNACLQRYNSRLDALNAAVSTVVPSYTQYSLNPYVNYTPGSNIPWQWKKDLDNSYYTIIQYVEGGIYFKQAIAFTRNIYSSSLVNAWDGSTLELDNENSAVLAKMISAGAKDSQGRFTGVMMGDWHEKADSSLDVVGLYGVKYGEQVFGFKTDGTGFIGKAGRGRIEFDGNKSLLSNSDKTCYLNLDPVTFNMSSGSIGGLNDYNGYSQYFLYAKVPKVSTPQISGNEVDNLMDSTYWATEFLKDSTNDYFIVDPNNGVLTTGGVIARYGKIGNWMISDQGLYQRKTSDVLKNNRYMYLGHADLNSAESNNIDARYAALYEALEFKRLQAIEDAKAKFQAETVEILGEYYKNIFNYDPMHYFNFGWPYESYVFALNDTINSISSSTPANVIKNTLQSNLKFYIEKETRVGYHYHYLNGERQDTIWYTGDRQVFSLFARGMTVSEPSPANYDYAPWAENSRYTNGEHRTVTFYSTLEPSSGSSSEGSDEPTTESEKIEGITIDEEGNTQSEGIVYPPSNIPSEYIRTDYYAYVQVMQPNGEPCDPPQYNLWRYYETEENPLIIEYNSDGYANEAALNEAETHIPLDMRFNHCLKQISSNKYRFYFCSGGVVFADMSSPIPTGEPSGGGGAEIDRAIIPFVSTTYYSEQDIHEGWGQTHTQFGSEEISAETINFDYGTTYKLEELIKIRAVALGLLRYYQDAYNRQLDEMLAAGRAELEGEALAEYERRKAQKEIEYKNYVNTVIEPLYTSLKRRLDERKAAEYAALLEACDDRYAIFAGYTPTSDPLFSVNWRGYFTARSGKIGNTSPWYIADRGLTQKNNSGTIFLGDPKTDGSESLNVFLGYGANNSKITVNDSQQNGANISLLSNAAEGIYIGPRFWIYDSNHQLKNTYGEFAIYAGDSNIKFGVRLDGSLLATRANIGGWLVDNTTIRSLPKATTDTSGNVTYNYDYQVILDSEDPKLIFGSTNPAFPGTILYGNGMLRLSAFLGTSGYTTVAESDALFGGTINLGGYFLQGITSAPVQEKVLLGMSYSSQTTPESNAEQEAASRGTQTVNYYFKQGVVTFPGKKYSPTTASHSNTQAEWADSNPNVFRLFDSTRKLSGSAGQNIGINILTGIIQSNSQITAEYTEQESTINQDRIDACEAAKTVLQNAIDNQLTPLYNLIETNTTNTNNLKNKYSLQYEALGQVLDWFNKVICTSTTTYNQDGTINTVTITGIAPNSTKKYVDYTAIPWSNIYFNVKTPSGSPVNNIIAWFNQATNNSQLTTWKNSTSPDYAVLKNIAEELLAYKTNVLNATYSTDYNVLDKVKTPYYKTSEAAVVAVIEDFKRNIGTLQNSIQEWADLMDTMTEIAWTIKTAILTAQSKITELDAEIASIRASAAISGSMYSGGVYTSADTALVLYPVGTKPLDNENENSNAVLGTPLYRWNLNAGAIDAYNINAKNIFADDGIYITNKKLATEDWTMEWIDWLASKIKDSSSGSGASASGSFSGLNNLASNLVKLLNMLTLYGGVSGSTSPTSELWDDLGTSEYLTIKFPIVTFHITDAKDGADSFDASKHADFSQTQLKINGANIPMGDDQQPGKYGYNSKGTIAYAGKILTDAINKCVLAKTEANASVDADGVVTLTFKSYDESYTQTITFDQAGTTYYRKHTFGEIQAGANYGITLGSRTATQTSVTSLPLAKKLTGDSVTYDKTNNRLYTQLRIMALDKSTQLAVGYIVLEATKPYNQGYADAAGQVDIKKDKITYPVGTYENGPANNAEDTEQTYDEGYKKGWADAIAKLEVNLKHASGAGTVYGQATIGRSPYLNLAGTTEDSTKEKVGANYTWTGHSYDSSSIQKNTTSTGAYYIVYDSAGEKEYVHYTASDHSNGTISAFVTWSNA